ncbi:hypothetical protein I5497_09085 [Citrobacter freundii]|nr:hypothetical protein [Citrobacter freundii]
MADKYFDDESMKESIQSYLDELSTLELDTNFSKQRHKVFSKLLKSFISQSKEWDQRTEHSIANQGRKLGFNISDHQLTNHNIDETFAICFNFVLEADMYDSYLNDHLTADVRDFCINYIDEIDPSARRLINETLMLNPSRILKRLLVAQDVKTCREFISNVQKSEQMIYKWGKDIEEKEKRAQKLSEAILRQEADFNFVGLYDGFFRLGQLKETEMEWAKKILIGLGILLPLPLCFEMLYMFFSKNSITTPEGLYKLIPIASITLIFIYYFRVALNNFNSIKAQLVQIELRKSLCCFIQSYADYAKEITVENENLLKKFEDIIFSNIMASEEKIPSTFDGINQLASLINSFKQTTSNKSEKNP